MGMTRKEQLIRYLLTGLPIEQVAALPWRATAGPASSAIREFLLITSRGNGRLILPKGWPMDRHSQFQTAEIEAKEEAGVVGTIETRPIGRFSTTKQIGATEVPVIVSVYPLKVETVLPQWKEAEERKRMWVPAHDAAALADDAGLSGLLHQIC